MEADPGTGDHAAASWYVPAFTESSSSLVLVSIGDARQGCVPRMHIIWCFGVVWMLLACEFLMREVVYEDWRGEVRISNSQPKAAANRSPLA